MLVRGLRAAASVGHWRCGGMLVRAARLRRPLSVICGAAVCSCAAFVRRPLSVICGAAVCSCAPLVCGL
ncbi:MAG: hypothetical protein IJF67_09975, partial [Clostridia bacterium]|nr:hypothetical protein [Clostridia bacterium]